MKKILLVLFIPFLGIAQNIQVDSKRYTPQELIEDLLIDSNCINNVLVTNAVGGNFNGTDQSYGYFDASGTSFPFQEGLILSTGRLQNTAGPNTSLSDDDASGWGGDQDLEILLNETSTTNATILEFDFTSVSAQISFRYIFASEEYQVNNANTCKYSDLFGFLIRPANSAQYTNIALVPNTQTPVKVTTVHPEISGGCAAENETYFDQFNGSNAPINFNGQTEVLTAVAQVVPNEVYHVKLVIADEQNYRYDSAVFLEAGSFKLNIDLGADHLLGTENPLCENEKYTLDATQPGMNSYTWFKDGIKIDNETSELYEAVSEGIYSVEVLSSEGCISYGFITLEYTTKPEVEDVKIVNCDLDQDGITNYNLWEAADAVVQNDNTLSITGFFNKTEEAELAQNVIDNPENFQNSITSQTVYARVENEYGCYSIATIQLEISNNTVVIEEQYACDDLPIDGYTQFDFQLITATFANQLPSGSVVKYYGNQEDALADKNALPSVYKNEVKDNQTVFVKITNEEQCYALTTLQLKVTNPPQLKADETLFYCINSYPEAIQLEAGLLENSGNYTFSWFFNGQAATGDTSILAITEPGVYSVTVGKENECSSTRNITVVASEIATITETIIEDGNTNNTITVSVSGIGNYVFALDDSSGDFQDNGIFTEVVAGFHVIYVKDKNGCGLTQKQVAVLGYPQYFTPNNDGYHDTWQLVGLQDSNYIVYIFDRYGKLIKQLDGKHQEWNGLYNGLPAPSNDYWFKARLGDGSSKTGHFSLIR